MKFYKQEEMLPRNQWGIESSVRLWGRGREGLEGEKETHPGSCCSCGGSVGFAPDPALLWVLS